MCAPLANSSPVATCGPMAMSSSSPSRSPKGPRPLATPRRHVLPTPLRQRPYLTPSPRRPIVPQLALIPATPVDPMTPPRRIDLDPFRLGKHWTETPLPLRIAWGEREAHKSHAQSQAQAPSSSNSPTVPRSSVSSPSPAGNNGHDGHGRAYDLHGAGVLEDLVWVATADDAQLASIAIDEIIAIIDDVLCAVPDEDRPAVHAILFGEDNDEVDLEVRTPEQLQDVCMVLAEELIIVNGKLRLMTDDSTF